MKSRTYPGLIFALILTFCLAGASPASGFSIALTLVSTPAVAGEQFPCLTTVLVKTFHSMDNCVHPCPTQAGLPDIDWVSLRQGSTLEHDEIPW